MARSLVRSFARTLDRSIVGGRLVRSFLVDYKKAGANNFGNLAFLQVRCQGHIYLVRFHFLRIPVPCSLTPPLSLIISVIPEEANVSANLVNVRVPEVLLRAKVVAPDA